MMIFMLILKIIGIVLCVIIGILAMILFVPVCYKVDADIDEMDYKVRIHWLAKLIRFELLEHILVFAGIAKAAG